MATTHRTRWIALTALLLATLLLTGCGGGGGDGGVKQDLEAQVEMLMTERDAAQAAQAKAETARKAAEEARAAAETAKAAAEEARATAETERDAAEAAKMTAAAEKLAAEAAQAEAVAALAEAKAAQTAAEAQRDKALADKTAIEADRDEKRQAATDAEIALVEAEAQLTAAQAEAKRLTGQLETANAEVTQLTNRIGSADDADSLQGMLAAEKAEVARLEGVIGEADDTADADGSLYARLNAAKAEVTRLEGVIGDASDAADEDGSLHAQLNAEKAEVMRLEGVIGDADDTADADGSLHAQLNAAKAEVTRLTAQIGTATDADSLQGKLEAEKLKVLRLQNQVDTLGDTITGLRGQLADLRDEVDEEKQRADQAERDAERKIKQAQEDAERQGNINVRAPLLITKFTSLEDATNQANVTHVPGGKRTFVRPFNLPSKGSAPSVPGSWGSASFIGPRGNVGTDTVYLYTNIQAPGSKAFWKEYGESITGLNTTFPTQAKVDNFGTSGTIRSLYTTNSATGSRSGTYDGYSGTFSCTSACNITADTANVFTFVGSWTFKANSLTTKRGSQHAEQDTEFLYFGIWAFQPTNPAATGDNVHDFDFVFGGDSNAGDGAISNFSELTGTATFAGGAIGNYALAKVGGREAKIGTFTATANFTADFDKAPDGTDGNRISGRITDFKEGGSSLGSDWHVFLGASSSAAIALTATGVNDDGVTAGSIDGDTASGTWAAGLHGSDNHDTFTDRTKYPVSRYPVVDLAGVSGWFNANAGTNAAIAGTFGAACTTTSGGNAGCAP